MKLPDWVFEVLLVALLVAGAFCPPIGLAVLLLTIALYAAFGGDDEPPAAGLA